MANQMECTWCRNYGASPYVSQIDSKRKLVSKQNFCCLKCKTQYDDRYGIEWIEEKKSNSGIILIIVLIILYILSQ
jgi:hypothetical protein